MNWIDELESMQYPITIYSRVNADKVRYWRCSISCGPFGEYSSEEYIHIKDAVQEVLDWRKEKE